MKLYHKKNFPILHAYCMYIEPIGGGGVGLGNAPVT